jgi:integrase
LSQWFAKNALKTQYLSAIESMSKKSARIYCDHLKPFESFATNSYGIDLDSLVINIREGRYNPYSILSEFTAYLQDLNYNKPLSTITLRNRVKVVKNFLEFNDVDISDNKFRLKVRLPKATRKSKEALTKDDIRDIILACSEIRLKTYVMFLASTGMRAVEALSIRLKDISFDSNPVRVTIRAEYTKTRQDRYVYLTSEMVQQLSLWLDYKYRYHRSCYADKDGNYKSEYITPVRKPDGLIFAIYNKPANSDLHTIYVNMAQSYAKMLDRIGKGDREYNNNKRRKITLHSFRRFIKSTISDLGYSDYSEWFIGHSGSTYYRKTEKEKAEIFRKIEPYLTFLDYSELEARGADVVTKLQEKDKQIEALTKKQEQFESMIQSLIDSGQLRPTINNVKA